MCVCEREREREREREEERVRNIFVALRIADGKSCQRRAVETSRVYAGCSQMCWSDSTDCGERLCPNTI